VDKGKKGKGRGLEQPRPCLSLCPAGIAVEVVTLPPHVLAEPKPLALLGADHDVFSVATVDLFVHPGARKERVIATAGVDFVIPCAAIDIVVAKVPSEKIIPLVTVNRVLSTLAHYVVLSGAAVEGVVNAYVGLSAEEKVDLDLSAQDVWDERMRSAGLDNDPAAFRVALKGWEQAGLEALKRVGTRGGAA
jgi:hypothetical protein